MKKTTAIMLTILMAASTLTACTQADGVAESSAAGPTQTIVSTSDEAEKPTQETTASTEETSAETSPVSNETKPSTTEPSKTEKSATSRNSGSVGQNSEDNGEHSESAQQSQNEAPKLQSKANPQTENNPKAAESPKIAEKPKATEAPKPKTTEKPAEQPKKKSIDFGRVTNALISYGTSLGMVYNGSLNTGNAGWFPPLDVSGYSDTDSVISAGYDEVGYLPYYFGSSAEPGDIAFNVIASNSQIYVVYG